MLLFANFHCAVKACHDDGKIKLINIQQVFGVYAWVSDLMCVIVERFLKSWNNLPAPCTPRRFPILALVQR